MTKKRLAPLLFQDIIDENVRLKKIVEHQKDIIKRLEITVEGLEQYLDQIKEEFEKGRSGAW